MTKKTNQNYAVFIRCINIILTRKESADYVISYMTDRL